MNYPRLDVSLSAIEQNARVLSTLCEKEGISLAGVIKFSDGESAVAGAYLAGGCKQIAVSRCAHLPDLRKHFPDTELMLIRAPAKAETETAARLADLILTSQKETLSALEEKAALAGTTPGILLMLDVGDLREGAESIEELVDLARFCEGLEHLRLRGVGTNLACLSGVLPNEENLSLLVEGACAVERAIGRNLEIISGGSSINFLLLEGAINRMPKRINHLRVGGIIANPINIRFNRGLTFEGMREDTVTLTAEILEIREKESAPEEATQNWSGEEVHRENLGRRLQALLEIGTQDIGDPFSLIPKAQGVTVLGGSSDVTVVDVTDCKEPLGVGDTLSFSLRYRALLQAFATRHVEIHME